MPQGQHEDTKETSSDPARRDRQNFLAQMLTQRFSIRMDASFGEIIRARRVVCEMGPQDLTAVADCDGRTVRRPRKCWMLAPYLRSAVVNAHFTTAVCSGPNQGQNRPAGGWVVPHSRRHPEQTSFRQTGRLNDPYIPSTFHDMPMPGRLAHVDLMSNDHCGSTSTELYTPSSGDTALHME